MFRQLSLPNAGEIMSKLVEIDGFWIEVADTGPAGPGDDSEDELVGGPVEKVADKLTAARGTIRSVCDFVRGSFEAANQPDEIEVTFGITVNGEFGVPYVTKAAVEAAITVKATWKNQAK